MKNIQNDFANNFGLVGKTLRKYMTTSALTAGGLMAIASPALADNWTDHVAFEGNIAIDSSIANTTNITQFTDTAKVRGDGDITANHTVNIKQNSGSSRYILFDVENDPTMIMGKLNANGQVYIFDQNGVIFGKDSVVNVGAIIASTAVVPETADVDSFINTVKLENFVPDSSIELNGEINVADAGLAAFVAPSVVNSGVINAKMGNVVLASGKAVTLDMYGDGLVEVAVDGELENALIENKGTISAEGGTVNITAAAAKDVVDNVINMDGVVDVSSVTVKGGKIILSGGSKGTVKVAGKLDASGTDGGDVAITGQNIDMANGSEIWADASGNDGNGGNILVYGNDYAIMSGSIFARGGRTSGNGGSAEVSAGESVGYYGFADLSAENGVTGTFLIDPKTLNINTNLTSGVLADVISGGNSTVNINDQALANTLRFSNVNLWATQDLNITSDIDISTWKGLLGAKGITNKDLTLAAPTVNILYDVVLGTGKLNIFDLAGGTSVLGFGILDAPAAGVEVDVVNLDGTIYKRSVVSGAKSVAGDSQINSQANTVNVKSNNAKIQQGIWFANDAGGGSVFVASGTYNESINVDKKVNLYGNNWGINPNFGALSNQTIIDPNSPGFYVTADGVLIDGFVITSADDGVLVDGADNVRIKNNIIHDVTQSGIEFANSSNGEVTNNRIDNTSDSAVLVTNGGNFIVEGNYIGQDVGSTIIGNGVLMKNVTGGTITRNRISNATQVVTTDKASGIYLDNSRSFMVGGSTVADGNIIKNSDWDGIKIKSGSGHTIRWNNIDDSTRVGIYSEAANDMKIWNNRINDSNVMAGVGVLGGENISVLLNSITDEADSTAGSGIEMTLVTGGNNIIENNLVRQINGFGINVNNSTNAKVNSNDVYDTRDDGITVRDADGTISVTENIVGKANGSSFVDGNGISLYRIDDANVSKNFVYHTNTVETDHASGVYLGDSNRILVSNNFIRNADWDGVKVSGGNENIVDNNNIADSTRVGVYGVATNDLIVKNNKIRNSNTTAGVGVFFSRNVEIDNNDIAYSYDDGIHVEQTNGNIRITNNTVDESADDGIEVVNSYAYTYIAGNTVTNSGIGISGEVEYDADDYYGNDGIHVRNVFENYDLPAKVRKGDAGTGEYNIVVYDNKVSDSADDGIQILGTNGKLSMISRYDTEGEGEYVEIPYFFGETGRVLVQNNKVKNSGYGFEYGNQDGSGADGIHVAGIYDYEYASAGSIGSGIFSGYAIDILGNKVKNSGDDGIEVVDSSSVLIDGNKVKNSGLVYVEDKSEEDGDGEIIVFGKGKEYPSDTGDYPWGADGIHVRNVNNNLFEGPIWAAKYSAGGETDEGVFTPYSVVIRNNKVKNSLDDGIQVLFSGDTLIDANIVKNSGSDVNPRAFGGDGINVVAGIDFGRPRISDRSIGYDDYIYPVNVTVSNNKVTNSNDDGIEVVGSTNVLIDTNIVDESGDDGINVLGFAGFYDEIYDGEDEGEYDDYELARTPKSFFGWPYFVANIVNNDVSNSGNDGIQSSGFDQLTVLSNEVTNSLANGLYVSSFNNGYSTVSGNTFTNNDIGAHFESGVVDLTGTGNTFNNGRVGLRFAPYTFSGGEGDEEGEIIALSLPTSIYHYLFPYPFMTPSSGFAPLSLVDNDGGPNSDSFPVVPPTNYGGTIGEQAFNGQGQYYVELDNGAFFEPGMPTWLNGMNSTYDGIKPADDADGFLDQATYDNIESKIFHYVDRQDLGLFFFGLRSPEVADINQNLIFNRFDAFNGDITGLNVRITGLPTIPGGGGPVQNFNNINTFAGGNDTNPTNLNEISTAAGGNENPEPSLNEIETESGGSSERCWSNAVQNAGNGQVTNVVYGGTVDDALAQAEDCAGTL